MKDKLKAFPNTYQDPDDGLVYVNDGMNLRDYFAAKALNGMLANNGDEEFADEILRRENYQEYCMDYAKSAYAMADAMMEARK